jgi:lysyl-tRNA synthetase class 1
LHDKLGAVPERASGEDIQNVIYEVGKTHGFEPLRSWFQALYEVLLGQSQGPRFGSFVELYGIEETREMIARAIAPKVGGKTSAKGKPKAAAEA